MLKVLTPDEMRKADKAAIESGIASFDLMRAAGRAVSAAASEMMAGTYGRRVAVLCGKGNNGGDGLVAAGYLARRGTSVKVLLAEDPRLLQGDARKALDSVIDSVPGLSVAPLHRNARRDLQRADLIIDALAGTGFRGALRGTAADAAEMVNNLDTKVLSVDIPSGVDGATGRVDGWAIRADKTVTLAALKPGLLLQPGAGYAGEVEIADIGIPEVHMTQVHGTQLAEAADVAALIPPRPPGAHKRSVGKVLVVAGSPGMSGAAILSASAALRAGAGLVWVAAPQSVSAVIEQGATEVVVAGLPETATGSMSARAVDKVLELADKADSVALGPGISTHPETLEVVMRLLGSISKPVVLDADGINAFEGRVEQLRSREAPTVLTPHAGELARLLNEDVKVISTGPAESARRAAAATKATVLLKGYPTFVAGPANVVAVNTGGPFLASAGTGDVLTGVISALAAHGEIFDAAWAGAWLHGCSGRLAAAALRRGPAQGAVDRGIVASDLLPALPQAIVLARAGELAE